MYSYLINMKCDCNVCIVYHKQSTDEGHDWSYLVNKAVNKLGFNSQCPWIMFFMLFLQEEEEEAQRDTQGSDAAKAHIVEQFTGVGIKVGMVNRMGSGILRRLLLMLLFDEHEV